jgi:hypothetical protein
MEMSRAQDARLARLGAQWRADKEAAMDGLMLIVTGLALLVLLFPLLAILFTVFVLVPLAHLAPQSSTVSRTSFACPFSKRTVRAAFLAEAGNDHPTDVLECSLFKDGPVACAKRCLELATVSWAPSPMTPRVSLIAGDEAFR